jgi:hypothetical protein
MTTNPAVSAIGTDLDKLYCREQDLLNILRDGEGTIYVVNRSRPFSDWVEIAQVRAPQPSINLEKLHTQLEILAAYISEDRQPEAEHAVGECLKLVVNAIDNQQPSADRAPADGAGELTPLPPPKYSNMRVLTYGDVSECCGYTESQMRAALTRRNKD